MEIKNDQEEIIDELPEEEEEGSEPDWKSLAQKNQGIAKRYQTKLDKIKLELEEAKKAKPKIEEPKTKKEKKGFGYAQKAFMQVNDVLPDEYPLALNIMNETGKTLEEVLASKYFRAEQKELRELKASADAIPSGTKRTSKSSKDDVDYWLAKDELPPADQPELRREYVNAKIKREQSGSPFTSRSVVQ